MNERLQNAQAIIERPAESLAVELKTWIDPSQPTGQSKIIKAALALRNHNGGYLVIGFDNKTLQPVTPQSRENVRQLFHHDHIQRIISNFSSEAFEVTVEFPILNGQEYPVIIIPDGVKTPVAASADLKIPGQTLISCGDVYVRTLNSNNTPSSAKIGWKDWQRLIDVCFENREADIGRFIRRQLSGTNAEVIQTAILSLAQSQTPETSLQERVERFIEEGTDRFKQVLAERSMALPKHGAWEVSLVLQDNVPAHSANREFLQLLAVSNPAFSGWPVWHIVNSSDNENDYPRPRNKTWEQFVDHQFMNRIIDFMIYDPRGKFYQRSALWEDLWSDSLNIRPLTVLDFSFAIKRSAEAIAVGMAYARAMGCVPDNARLMFGFRWTGLRKRMLGSVYPGRLFFQRGPAHDDHVESFVEVPLSMPLSALGSIVERVVCPLFEVFDGYKMDAPSIEQVTREALKRNF